MIASTLKTILLSIACLISFESFSQTIATPKRILFVGNSYTYQWSLPQTVEDMARKTNQSLIIQHSTAGGANWGHHWRGERGLQTKQIIKEGKFDIVILQNHSLRAIEAPDSLHHYGEKFNQLIRRSGATPMLYMTWAREWNPLMIETIAKEYEALGKEIDAFVVPVGRIWQKARLLRPDLNLYAKDGSHQSPTGMYLNCLCLLLGGDK